MPTVTAEHGQLHGADRDAGDLEAGLEVAAGKLQWVRAPDVCRHVLQDDREAQRAEHRCDERGITQWLVGDLLDHDRQYSGHQHARAERDGQWIAGEEKREADEPANHEEFGNREIEDPEDAHDERE